MGDLGSESDFLVRSNAAYRQITLALIHNGRSRLLLFCRKHREISLLLLRGLSLNVFLVPTSFLKHSENS